MNTPITDAVYPPDVIDREFAAHGHSWGWGTLYEMRNTARRLELDRAALMEALVEIHQESEMGSFAENRAWDALTAARANFPKP